MQYPTPSRLRERGGDIRGAGDGRVGPGPNSFLQFPGTVKL